jgi:drug/metabolite transporter (DMT)-like permease
MTITTVDAGSVRSSNSAGGAVQAIDRLRRWAPGPTAATMAIVATSFATAGASFFIRRLTDAGVTPVTVAFARFALTAIVLGRFVRFDPGHRTATSWGLASGAGMAVGWIAYVHAVDEGTVAGAGVVYMTYPLFAMLALATLFRVRPSSRQVAGGVLVLAGAAVALGPSGSIPWLAVVAPATFGLSIAVLTERLGVLDPFERLGSVATGASLALLPIVATRPIDELLPERVGSWVWIIGLGIGSALVPMLVYAAAAPRVGAARAAVAGSFELPVMIVVGLLLGEAVGRSQWLGAITICVAVVLTATTRPAYAIPGEQLTGSGEAAPTSRVFCGGARRDLVVARRMLRSPHVASSTWSRRTRQG